MLLLPTSEGSLGASGTFVACRGQGNDPVAVFELANNQFRLEKCAFRDDETPLQKRDEGKSNSQSRGLNNAGIRIRWIRHADPAKHKSAPGRVHGTSDFDLGSERSDRRVADALLYAVGLQVQIDTKKDDCGCDENASRNEKKSLGKCGHAGKLRNFSGM